MTGDALQWYSCGDSKGIHAVNPLHSSPLHPSPLPEHFDCALAQSPKRAKEARRLWLSQRASRRFIHRNRTTEPETRNIHGARAREARQAPHVFSLRMGA